VAEFIVEVVEPSPITVTVEEPSGDVVVVESVLAPDAIEVIQEGPPGPPGPAAVGHVQSTPDTTWTINHNLGYYPAFVQAWDENGDRISGGVEDESTDTLLIHHTNPQSGIARLA